MSQFSVAASSAQRLHNYCSFFHGSANPFSKPLSSPSTTIHHPTRFSIRVANESERGKLSSEVVGRERSDADKLVDGMDFGELCNEFECISSPAVEATARLLVKDIIELREGNRAIGTYAVSVKYKDPVRSFTGREKYNRPLWITDALENPTASVQEMVMLSTSVLNIKWTIKGKPKSVLAGIAGDLIIKVDSKFTLNQISGQVVEHEEVWDLSSSSVIARTYFWTSRRLYASIEAGKDTADFVKELTRRFTTENKNMEVYPDSYSDPTKSIGQVLGELLGGGLKGQVQHPARQCSLRSSQTHSPDRLHRVLVVQFFQRDDDFQRDFYQIALFLAVVYFVIQFLRTTL